VESGAGNVSSMWSSFNHGLIHFVMIDTETDYPNSAGAEGPNAPITSSINFGGNPSALPQLTWLQNDLLAVDRAVTPWVVVCGHRPAYTSAPETAGTNAAGVADSFTPYFRQYSVDLYLAGHIHNYERLYPLGAGGAPALAGVSGNVYTNPSVPVYIVNGAAGNDEGHDDFPQNTTISAAYNTDEFGLGTLQAFNETHLQWQFFSAANGAVIDSLWIVKPPRLRSRVITVFGVQLAPLVTVPILAVFGLLFVAGFIRFWLFASEKKSIALATDTESPRVIESGGSSVC